MEDNSWAELIGEVAESISEGAGWRVWLCIGGALLVVVAVVALS